MATVQARAKPVMRCSSIIDSRRRFFLIIALKDCQSVSDKISMVTSDYSGS